MLLKCNTHCFLKIKAVAFHFPASSSLPARMSCVVRFAWCCIGKNSRMHSNQWKGIDTMAILETTKTQSFFVSRQDANPNFRKEASNYHNSWRRDLRKPEGIASQLKDGGIMILVPLWRDFWISRSPRKVQRKWPASGSSMYFQLVCICNIS